MAWETGFSRDTASIDSVLVRESQRTFMAGVYRWMFAGLALTGAVAVYTVSNVGLLQFVVQNMLLLIIAQLGLVFALGFVWQKLSPAAAGGLFLGYAALNGLTLSSIFLVYRLGSIGTAFFVTAGAFGALSIYGAVTKKNLDAWRSFLMIGLFGILIAAVVNIFIQSSALMFVYSCAGVLVFGGLVAYDTQKLRELHAANIGHGGLAVIGALRLYLDFVNLFLSLLRIFGRRR